KGGLCQLGIEGKRIWRDRGVVWYCSGVGAYTGEGWGRGGALAGKQVWVGQLIPPAPVVHAGQHVALEILAAYTAWIKEQELLQTTRDFHSYKHEEGQSVSSYVLKMKGYIENLERLGHPVTLGLGTIKELHAMLKLHEQTLPKNNVPALHAIRVGHWKRNCPQYIAELLKKKKTQL
nr:zinc finger, CCHC-type [Tanacetum cinerariifolium]